MYSDEDQTTTIRCTVYK